MRRLPLRESHLVAVWLGVGLLWGCVAGTGDPKQPQEPDWATVAPAAVPQAVAAALLSRVTRVCTLTQDGKRDEALAQISCSPTRCGQYPRNWQVKLLEWHFVGRPVLVSPRIAMALVRGPVTVSKAGGTPVRYDAVDAFYVDEDDPLHRIWLQQAGPGVMLRSLPTWPADEFVRELINPLVPHGLPATDADHASAALDFVSSSWWLRPKRWKEGWLLDSVTQWYREQVSKFGHFHFLDNVGPAPRASYVCTVNGDLVVARQVSFPEAPGGPKVVTYRFRLVKARHNPGWGPTWKIAEIRRVKVEDAPAGAAPGPATPPPAVAAPPSPAKKGQ